MGAGPSSLDVAELRNKVVVITGCDTGFGHDLAIRCVQEYGMVVYAGCITQEGISDLSSKGVKAVRWDVTKDADAISVRNLVEKEQPNGIYCVVANAGIEIGSLIEWTPIDEARLMFDINVFGVTRTMNAMTPSLRKYARGNSHPARVIVLASVAGKFSASPIGYYCASKHAVEAVIDAARLELAPFGIAVSMLEPFYAKTNLVLKTDFVSRHMKYFLNLPEEAKQAYGLQFAEGVGRQQKEVLTAPNTLEPNVIVDKLAQVLRIRWPVDRYMVAPTFMKVIIFLWMVVSRYTIDVRILRPLLSRLVPLPAMALYNAVGGQWKRLKA